MHASLAPIIIQNFHSNKLQSILNSLHTGGAEAIAIVATRKHSESGIKLEKTEKYMKIKNDKIPFAINVQQLQFRKCICIC